MDHSTDRSSLDRLKAFNSLSDLSAQLSEAKRLCTHSARADMIAKWLLERMKLSVETRMNVEAWNCLQSTLRLLSPERATTLLQSFDLLGLMKAGLDDSHDGGSAERLLFAFTDLINLLLSMSQSTHGALIKSVLIAEATQVAGLLAVWMSRLCEIASSRAKAVSHADSEDVEHMLHPALRIWDMRKRSVDENEVFAKHCLVPAASLMSLSPSFASPQSVKRKRRQQGESQQNCTQILESLFARHIFVPARTAFSRVRDFAASKDRAQLGPQGSISNIRAMLEPLKTSCRESGGDSAENQALPLLLNTALRCVPDLTPRKRMKEQIWIEAVFEALQECNKDSDGKLKNYTTLIKMLEVVSARITLSTETLEKIIRLHSQLQGPPGAAVVWGLVAQVATMRADIFVSEQMAESLFSQLTSATVKTDDKSSSEDDEVSRRQLQSLWRDQIIIPILRAFARSRKLNQFTELWWQQLQKDGHNEKWSVWLELDQAFQALLEESFAEDQIVNLFDRFEAMIGDASGARNGIESGPSERELGASIVVLNAILGGVNSESLLSTIHERLEPLFENLLQLFDLPKDSITRDQSAMSNQKRSWALMTKGFEAWLPTWATQQSDTTAAVAKGTSLLSRTAVTIAFNASSEIRPYMNPSAQTLQQAIEAGGFVASLCSHFLKYKEGMDDEAWMGIADLAGELMVGLMTSDLQAILRHSALLTIFEEHSARNHRRSLQHCIEDAKPIGKGDDASLSTLRALRAFAATAVAHAQPERIEHLVQGALDDLDRMAEAVLDVPEGENFPDMPDQETVVFDLLSRLPATTLTRVQREKILNTVVEFQDDVLPASELHFQQRLTLLVQLMEVPNATCSLSTDADAIWDLALSVSVDEYVRSKGSSSQQLLQSETMWLLEELTRLILKHLLATQDQERSCLMINSMSLHMNKVMKLICDDGQFYGCGAVFALSKAIMQELEYGCGDSLKHQLPHRDPSRMFRFVEVLFEVATPRVAKMTPDQSSSTETTTAAGLIALLDTLLAIPVSLIAGSSESTSDFARILIDAVKERLKSFGANGIVITLKDAEAESVISHEMKAIFARCYQIGCKHASSNADINFPKLALQLLQLELQPAEHEILLAAFDQFVDNLDNASRIILLEHLLKEDDFALADKLLLARVCLEKVDRDDTSHSGLPQLVPQLLSAAAKMDDLLAFERAIGCILMILKQKSFLVNQFSIERILVTLPKLLNDRVGASMVYLDVCRVMSSLLLHHRFRLHGRFHLVINVFQAIISRLFRKPGSKTQSPGKQVTTKHAHALSRLLSLFCEPPTLRRNSKASSLVDESRKEQAHVGQYAQYILHHYCAEVLKGSLGEGLKESLSPGLWSVIEAMEINDADGIKSLSAAMNNSERAVLRAVYDDWKRSGKWLGG